MKILIMGLPGSGKTHLAVRLQRALNCAWYNADAIRKAANDWDFSPAGRYRQAERMYTLASFEDSHDRIVICDFICPTEETRSVFNADYTIWMNTIIAGRFQDTNKMFEEPKSWDMMFDKFLTDEQIEDFAKEINIV